MSPSSLTGSSHVSCLDQLADLALWEAEPAPDPVVVESALMRRLATVPDRRSACGLRHPLVAVLTLAACATPVVGGDSVAAIWQWAARSPQAVLARAAAHALLSGPDADWTQTTAVDDDHGHGRTERRTIRTASADDGLFPGARQAFRLRRDVGELDGAWTGKEIVFGITGLPVELAGPAHLNHYERAHRGVENRLNWVGNVTFAEEHSQVRTGTAPRTLASLRNLAISTIRLAGRANIAHARRDLLDHDAAFAVYNI